MGLFLIFRPTPALTNCATNFFNVSDKLGKRELDIEDLAELEKRGRGTNAITLASSIIPVAYDFLKGEWVDGYMQWRI